MSLKQSLRALPVVLAAASLAPEVTGCNDEHPTLCSITKQVRDTTGNLVAYECQCEKEDNPSDPVLYSADNNVAPAACQAEADAIIKNGPVQCRPEICDGIDNDCDGFADEGCGGAGGNGCTSNPEYCDGYDNNCNGVVDEGCGTGGTGGSNNCSTNVEYCNGVDDNCNGQVDEGCSAETGTVYERKIANGEPIFLCGNDYATPSNIQNCDAQNIGINMNWIRDNYSYLNDCKRNYSCRNAMQNGSDPFFVAKSGTVNEVYGPSNGYDVWGFYGLAAEDGKCVNSNISSELLAATIDGQDIVPFQSSYSGCIGTAFFGALNRVNVQK